MHDVSIEALTAWTKNLARRKPLGEITSGKESLAELAPILAPLFEVGKGSPNPNLGPVIRPEDTIVFCPTGVLHKLPLHAVPIDGVPVIETHPVVYCPSLTILQHFFETLKTRREKDSTPKSLVLNPMASHWDKAQTKPVESTPTVERLASTLGAEYLHGCDLTKDSVTKSLTGVSTFHYHGHVHFEKTSALTSYMILSAIHNDDPSTEEPPLSSRVSAADLFSGALAPGALATVVGCQSGAATVSAADDVLGIPMALHYAGAAATVAALWRLDDGDGAAWAEAFYGDLMGQGGYGAERAGGEVKNLANLALGMQRAVRRLRFDDKGKERAPYHWAGYVLSGFWIFPFGPYHHDSAS
jgi:CHAT domain-containing protein